MTPPVLFPDAVAVTIDRLRGDLAARGDSAVVDARVPNERPTRLVVVRRVGGVIRPPVVDDAMLVVEAWDAREEDAHDLSQLCRAFVHAMRGSSQGGVAVYGVSEAAGPALLPDPLTGSPRYSFTVTVALRGAALV